MVAHTTLAPASPACCDPLTGAYVKLMADLMANRPRELRAINSPADLIGRAVDIEAHVLIFATWIEALVEDSASHFNLPRREADYVKDVLLDMASDLRGKFMHACESVQT